MHACSEKINYFYFLFLLIIFNSSSLYAGLYLSSDNPVSIEDKLFKETDLLYYQPSGFTSFLSGENLGIPVGVNLDAFGHFAGNIFFSVDIPTSLDGLVLTERDIVFYDGLGFRKLLDGSIAGIPEGAAIDAATMLPDGSLIFSVDVPVSLKGNSFKTNDLIRYDGSSFNLYFNGSENGIPENVDIDAVWISTAGEILFSFDIPCFLDGMEVSDNDVIKWSEGSFSKYFDGSLAGMPLTCDIDALYSDVDPSLILFLPFEDDGGTTTDFSGNENNGAVNGPSHLKANGLFNSNAYQFKWSSQDNIQVSYQEDQSVSNALTIEAWIYPTAWDNIYTGYNRIISKQPVYLLRGANGFAQFQVLTENHGYVGMLDSKRMSLNEWHYIVGTFDGTILNLYVDGVLQSSIELSDKDRLVVNEMDIYIGEYPLLNEGFTGLIDNVAIYRRVRDENEIKNEYDHIMIELLGDISHDKDVDGEDIIYFMRAFGSLNTDENYNIDTDLNNDGYINELDLAIFAWELGRNIK